MSNTLELSETKINSQHEPKDVNNDSMFKYEDQGLIQTGG